MTGVANLATLVMPIASRPTPQRRLAAANVTCSATPREASASRRRAVRGGRGRLPGGAGEAAGLIARYRLAIALRPRGSSGPFVCRVPHSVNGFLSIGAYDCVRRIPPNAGR